MNSFSTRWNCMLLCFMHYMTAGGNAAHLQGSLLRLNSPVSFFFLFFFMGLTRKELTTGWRMRNERPTCNHCGWSLTSLRFDPHLQGEISSGYLHAGFQPQLVAPAGEIHSFPPVRRVLLRLLRGAPALAEHPSLQAGQGAFAPGKTRGTSPRRGGSRLPNAHQLPLGSPLSPGCPALWSKTQEENHQARHPGRCPKFHFSGEEMAKKYLKIRKRNNGITRKNIRPQIFSSLESSRVFFLLSVLFFLKQRYNVKA